MDEKNINTQNQNTTEETAESKVEQETKDIPKEDETLIASLKKKASKIIAWTTSHKKELVYMGVGFAAGAIFGMRYAGKISNSSVANVTRTVANTVGGSPYTTYRYSSPAADPVASIAVRLVKEALK